MEYPAQDIQKIVDRILSEDTRKLTKAENHMIYNIRGQLKSGTKFFSSKVMYWLRDIYGRQLEG